MKKRSKMAENCSELCKNSMKMEVEKQAKIHLNIMKKNSMKIFENWIKTGNQSIKNYEKNVEKYVKIEKKFIKKKVKVLIKIGKKCRKSIRNNRKSLEKG